MLPKMVESSKLGIIKTIMNKDFLQLASSEFLSSLSKRIMINRVREFIPDLIPSAFSKRGTSGIRSSLIDRFGVFFPDTLKVKNDYSLHILNYNSPGATGALPIAASLAKELFQEGHMTPSDEVKALWNVNEVSI
jgi:L-2-hydroxyglutarate oxidase